MFFASLAVVHAATPPAAAALPSPAVLGGPVPPGVTWVAEVDDTRSGTRAVAIGGVEVEEQVTITGDRVSLLTWLGRGPAAAALAVFHPVPGLAACPSAPGAPTAAVGRGVVEIRTALPTGLAVVLATNPAGTCPPTPPRSDPPASPPAATAWTSDPELPWNDPSHPPPAEALDRVRFVESPPSSGGAAWARHVTGWCVTVAPRVEGVFAFTGTAGGWLPEPVAGARSADADTFVPCVFVGLGRTPAEGRLAVEVAPPPG